MFPTLVLLHGWGGSKESFAELRAALGNAPVRIIAPDLPGFGGEPEPERPWTVDDYTDWVEERIMRTGFEGPIHLLGHSHGGRIAIKMALRGNIPIAHLYLCAAAGIRHPAHAKRWFGYALAKCGRALTAIPGLGALHGMGKQLLYKLMGVHDYERASPLMQQTMLLVTREDFRPMIGKVDVPTDIFWGTDDRLTPLRDGEFMHANIPGSRFHVFQGMRHGVHRTAATDIARVITRELEHR